MVERKTRYAGIVACLIGICILSLAFSENALAKKKIRLNVGFGSEEVLKTLQTTPFQVSEMGAVFWPLVYDQLWVLGPGPNYDPLPALATSWETEDYQTWRFHLVKNAKFHDGKPVTAEDVAFSLWYLPRDPVWAFPSNDINAKKDIKIIDKYTIEFTLARPFPGKYPPVDWMPILPKHIWYEHKGRKITQFKNKKAIGSGPFKLKEFKSSQYIWMVKNKKYWGEQPHVDEVVFKGYGTEDGMKLAMKKGEIDFIGYSGVAAMSVKGYENVKNIDVNVSPGIAVVWLTFNLHKETAVQDKVVRKAFLHGIDRDRIFKLVYRGYAQPADSFIYPELDEYNPNLPKYEYNPELARTMLKNAGYSDTDGDGILNDKTGQNIVLEFMAPSEWSDEVKMLKLIKEQVKEIGIGIKEKILELDTYYEFVYQPTQDEFDITVSSEEPGPNGSWMWEFVRSKEGGGLGWNQSDYASAEMDETIINYLAETDIEKRKAYAFKLQEIMAEDLPCAVLVRPDLIGPYRTDKFEGHVATMGGFSNWINWWTYMKIKPKK
ncbi:MAG: peptide ABC transporter substrate-binding protein [Deltaproteobacteria bacterium]|nr:peptide ABC transporter substrate-binding protein [Deltaproteobacteria bacterium]